MGRQLRARKSSQPPKGTFPRLKDGFADATYVYLPSAGGLHQAKNHRLALNNGFAPELRVSLAGHRVAWFDDSSVIVQSGGTGTRSYENSGITVLAIGLYHTSSNIRNLVNRLNAGNAGGFNVNLYNGAGAGPRIYSSYNKPGVGDTNWDSAWVNGFKDSTGNGSWTTAADTRYVFAGCAAIGPAASASEILHGKEGSSPGGQVSIEMVVIWPRKFSEQEMRQITADPYSIFQAPIRLAVGEPPVAPEIAPQGHEDLAPLGRDFDYQLEGFQQDVVPADNETATSTAVSYLLPPDGRNFDFELEGFQRDVVGGDNEISHSTEVNYDLHPQGRDFDYELVGYQAAPLSEDAPPDPNAPTAYFDLPPAGRNYNYELRGFQHIYTKSPLAFGVIELVQKTTQLFHNNTTVATRELTAITPGNLLTATVASINVDNTSPVPSLPIPLGWNIAIVPNGSTGIEAYRGVVGIYWRIATATVHSINFMDSEALPPNSYTQITIEEWSGANTTDPLDVVACSALALPQTAGTSGTTAVASQPAGLAIAIGLPGGGNPQNLSTPAATGYTSIDTNPNMETTVCYEASYKILSEAGAQTASWSWTNDASWTGAIAVFNAEEADPAVDQIPAWSALAPEGRNFEYELDGFQQGVVGPNFVGDDAATSVSFFEMPAEGEDFDYELSGYQQGVVGADANQDNVIPMWFELPQQAVDYGNYIQPFIYEGVGPEGIPLFSEVSKFTDNPPVMEIVREYDLQVLPLSANAPPALLSEPEFHFENPVRIEPILNDVDQGFISGPVGPDSAVILVSDPATETELPVVLWTQHPSYQTFAVGPIVPDAFFTDEVKVVHDKLPPAGKDFDYQLEAFQRAPLSIDNTEAVSAAYYEIPPIGRDFDYELAGFQQPPLAFENQLANALTSFDLPREGRNFDYELEGHQFPVVGDDANIEPVGLSIAYFELPQEGRNFDYELAGYQYGIVPDDAPDTFPFPCSYSFDLPPEGRNFDYQLEGFKAEPAVPDPIPVMPTMLFPAEFFPQYPEDDISPWVGLQVMPPIPNFVPPNIDSGPSFYIPTFRPRRR